eukprot:gene35104-47166_t
MHEIKVGDDAALSAEAVWAVIGDFSGIRKWAGALEAESTEVTPKGKVRTLTMPGGRTIQELMTDGAEILVRANKSEPVAALAWNAKGTRLAFAAQDGDGGLLELLILRSRALARRLEGRPRADNAPFRFPDDLRSEPILLPSLDSDIRLGFDR